MCVLCGKQGMKKPVESARCFWPVLSEVDEHLWPDVDQGPVEQPLVLGTKQAMLGAQYDPMCI